MSRIPEKVITLVIGSACSGKSTLAGYLGRKGHGITFRASSYLSEFVANKYKSKGKTLADFIGPDFLAHIPNVDDAQLLCDAITDIVHVENRVIVDGFPRSLHQMYTMQRCITELMSKGHVMRVVNLVVPVPELLRRMYKRNRHSDTEQRILAEVAIHKKIADILRAMSVTNQKLSYLEFIIPDGADKMDVKRDFTPDLSGNLTEIPLMDSICRRMSEIFNDIEFKRKDGYDKKGSDVVHL